MPYEAIFLFYYMLQWHSNGQVTKRAVQVSEAKNITVFHPILSSVLLTKVVLGHCQLFVYCILRVWTNVNHEKFNLF